MNLFIVGIIISMQLVMMLVFDSGSVMCRKVCYGLVFRLQVVFSRWWLCLIRLVYSGSIMNGRQQQMMLMQVVVGVLINCSFGSFIDVISVCRLVNCRNWLSRLLWFRIVFYVYMWIRNEVYDGSIISIIVMLCVVGDRWEMVQVIGQLISRVRKVEMVVILIEFRKVCVQIELWNSVRQFFRFSFSEKLLLVYCSSQVYGGELIWLSEKLIISMIRNGIVKNSSSYRYGMLIIVVCSFGSQCFRLVVFMRLVLCYCCCVSVFIFCCFR